MGQLFSSKSDCTNIYDRSSMDYFRRVSYTIHHIMNLNGPTIIVTGFKPETLFEAVQEYQECEKYMTAIKPIILSERYRETVSRLDGLFVHGLTEGHIFFKSPNKISSPVIMCIDDDY